MERVVRINASMPVPEGDINDVLWEGENVIGASRPMKTIEEMVNQHHVCHQDQTPARKLLAEPLGRLSKFLPSVLSRVPQPSDAQVRSGDMNYPNAEFKIHARFFVEARS